MYRRTLSLGILALLLLVGVGVVSANWESSAEARPAVGLLADPAAPITTTTRIGFVPQYQEVRVGAVVTVTLKIVEAEDLYAAEVKVVFDADLLQVVDAQAAVPGVQILPGDFPAPPLPISTNVVDNEKGEIIYATTILGGQSGRYGPGILATITFEAVAEGTGTMSFERVWMYSPSMGELAAIVGGKGRIVISPVEIHATYLPLLTRNAGR